MLSSIECILVFGSTSWIIYGWIFAALGLVTYALKNILVYFGCLEKYQDEDGVQYTTSKSCMKALAKPFNSCTFEHGAFEESCAGKIFAFFAILFGSILIVILVTIYLVFNAFLFLVLYTYVSNAGGIFYLLLFDIRMGFVERFTLEERITLKL